MTQQKSEGRIVPEGPGNLAPTRSSEGGKAIPVRESARQLGLRFAAAERSEEIGVEAKEDLSSCASSLVPKAKRKSEERQPAKMMEEIAMRLSEALQKVRRNRGAPGPDGQTIEHVREHWLKIQPVLSRSLVEGKYRPGAIRRVEIPKPGGGSRKLGIPNVVDRVVQEAMRRTLEPLFEPLFHSSRHGFRPHRSCHTAISEGAAHLQAIHDAGGDGWVVDLDMSLRL